MTERLHPALWHELNDESCFAEHIFGFPTIGTPDPNVAIHVNAALYSGRKKFY